MANAQTVAKRPGLTAKSRKREHRPSLVEFDEIMRITWSDFDAGCKIAQDASVLN